MATFAFASLVVTSIWVWKRCVRSLHLLQLDSYSNARLIKWLWFAPLDRMFDYRLALLNIGLLGIYLMLRKSDAASISHMYIVLGLWMVGSGLMLFHKHEQEVKKPLVYTSRAVRILSVALITAALTLGLAGTYIFLSGDLADVARFTALTLLSSLMLIQLCPVFIILSNVALIPVQSAINKTYVRSAKSKLKKSLPIVIGVAGSYGKTSTKYFLATLLAERYQVLKTPQSYNTLMGVCRVINEALTLDHEVFIVEMGAYRRGDVKEIADLVEPRVGIITSIGPEHFERFKSIENIEAANYELIQSLPASGIAVFNSDIENCRKLADATNHVKVLRYGIEDMRKGLRLRAEEIKTGANGLSFTLVDDEGNRVETKTLILGKHNVSNIVGAACIALEMGISLQRIARAIAKIEPVPHRLQLIQGSGGTIVIDDSYNSNPLGAAEALNVLKEFETGRKILVTPGMVELGTLEAQENKEFGMRAAHVCDYVILVGHTQTRPILQGLEQAHFATDNIRTVKDLSQAVIEMNKIVQPGDIVLFENDLPDLYSEG